MKDVIFSTKLAPTAHEQKLNIYQHQMQAVFYNFWGYLSAAFKKHDQVSFPSADGRLPGKHISAMFSLLSRKYSPRHIISSGADALNVIFPQSEGRNRAKQVQFLLHTCAIVSKCVSKVTVYAEIHIIYGASVKSHIPHKQTNKSHNEIPSLAVHASHSGTGRCLGDSPQSRSWVAGRETSGRCHCGPRRHTGKCFCLALTSSSGSWSRAEQYSSVLINFWPSAQLPPAPISHPTSLYLLLSSPLLSFCSLTCFLQALWMEVSEEQNVMNAPYIESPACDHCTVPKMSQIVISALPFVVFFPLFGSFRSSCKEGWEGVRSYRNCLKSSSMPVID